jgi:hypothetical protein
MATWVLHIYPIWKSLRTLQGLQAPQRLQGEIQGPDDLAEEQKVRSEMAHWITFWIASFCIMNTPLPAIFQWIALSVLYFPESSSKARMMMLEYMPAVETRAFDVVNRLRRQFSRHLVQVLRSTAADAEDAE